MARWFSFFRKKEKKMGKTFLKSPPDPTIFNIPLPHITTQSDVQRLPPLPQESSKVDKL